MKRMTCGNGGIGLGIALGLAEAVGAESDRTSFDLLHRETQKSP